MVDDGVVEYLVGINRLQASTYWLIGLALHHRSLTFAWSTL
jgi:hypothetical protein